MAKVFASILNGDLAHLADVAEQIAASGADALHYDVMDGRFVDNLSFGIPVLQSLRPFTKLPIDVHLMIDEPHRFAERFIAAGADMLSFHIESRSDAAETIRLIHSLGVPAGIAVSPDTPAKTVFPLLRHMQPEDFILIMTVYPGLGGQQFMPQVLPKIKQLHEKLLAEELPLHIEVDGGINAETALLCRNAGADYLVAGSYVVGAEQAAERVASLRYPE